MFSISKQIHYTGNHLLCIQLPQQKKLNPDFFSSKKPTLFVLIWSVSSGTLLLSSCSPRWTRVKDLITQRIFVFKSSLSPLQLRLSLHFAMLTELSKQRLKRALFLERGRKLQCLVLPLGPFLGSLHAASWGFNWKYVIQWGNTFAPAIHHFFLLFKQGWLKWVSKSQQRLMCSTVRVLLLPSLVMQRC